ncbi:chemotaxis protein CheW [Pigmentibacter sp. JX0631]|uniref:hybrid sensor histidine kinase/response regulator n=1 Tax=Pigmentibacter sp. JX0631 TaxID=2976982 RepID=UPI002469B14B|nr:chemotaxis protein CheW [Pigmentibacter sp. JX0631]WGL59129.1 chemotaxis protein CheW [Pigmentibacter sp. JX0631]
MAGKHDAAFQEYIEECQEMLERISSSLNEIQKNGLQEELLASIYRDIHTIKGSAQLFGFLRIGQFAHALETCLDPVRKEKLPFSKELIDCIFTGIDFMQIALLSIKSIKKEPEQSKELDKLLIQFFNSIEMNFIKTQPLIKEVLLIADKPQTLGNNINLTERVGQVSSNKGENTGFGFFGDDLPKVDSGNVNLKKSSGSDLQIAKKEEQIQKNSQNTITSNENKEIKKVVVEDNVNETIRVQVVLLNSLMNLVGELVLIRNQLLQHAKENDENQEFLKMSQRLNILTAELQTEVMKTRMQPIGNILTVYSRVVRDLSRELDKKIELQLHGVETELDKTVIEAVKDPLMHIVRNAIDHGIETIEERKKLGKKETALIQIKAYNENGLVIIEVIDDGKGLDIKRIGEKAVEKGFATIEQLAKMTEKEIQMFIFYPGFSTAATVSNISGRGVGMDVVKTNIEKIGGIVDLFSTQGQGTTVVIKIPLSLAILPALIVKANEQKFAIPQTKLVELIMIDGTEQNSEKIESLQGNMVFRLRGKLIPIISLSEVLFSKKVDLSIIEKSIANVVILNADNFLFGLIVDDIDDSADIVVKPLTQFLKELKVFSGASIMGDGTVALTLDVLGIAARAHISLENSEEKKATLIKSKISNYYHHDSSEYLLIDVGAPGHYAVPLTLVNRIEEFEQTAFEFSGEQKVIRYRESLLPIFSLPQFLNLQFEMPNKIETTRIPIIVVKKGQNFYGIEVNAVHDIIEVTSKINQSIKDRLGILGTITTDNNIIVVADILNMIEILKEKIQVGHVKKPDEINDEVQEKDLKSQRINCRILYAEDSSFFRNYVKTVLEDAGFIVDTAFDGANALEILEKAPKNHYCFVLSDIEMPQMDGLELARRVKGNNSLSHLPMMAITTKFGSKDIEEGKKAGFLNYMEKLNAEKMVKEIDKIVLKTVPASGE